MKRMVKTLAVLLLLGLVGCIEITQEITIKKDGSGVWQSTTDMSAMMTFLKSQMKDDTSGKEKMAIDTLLAFGRFVDSMPDLSAEQKQLLRGGSVSIRMNAEKEQFLLTTTLPFQKTDDLNKLTTLMQGEGMNVLDKIMNKSVGDNSGEDEGVVKGEQSESKDLLMSSLPENYFTMEFSKGRIARTLDKEKYEQLAGNQMLSQLKEMGSMGAPFKSTLIFHVPKKVKKAEGKGVTVSKNKKTVTIVNDLQDLFDDPSKFEFVIEYK